MALPVSVFTESSLPLPAPSDAASPELRLVRIQPPPFRTTVVCSPDAGLVAALEHAAGHAARLATDELSLSAELDAATVRTVLIDGVAAAGSAPRLARIARTHPSAPAVWLMVARKDAQSVLLAQGLGVELLTRKPRTILAAVDPAAARLAHVEAMASVLVAIDEAFRAHAGPLGQLGVQAAHQDLLDGRIAPTPEAYAQLLVNRLRLPGPRSRFVTQAQVALQSYRAARMSASTHHAGKEDLA